MDKLFIFYKQEIVIKRDNNTYEIPSLNMLLERVETEKFLDLGIIDEFKCFSYITENKIDLPEGYEYKRIRTLFDNINEKTFWLAGKVFHLSNWRNFSTYCGKCGSKTKSSKKERAQICENCNNIIYPRISPAIIVSVVKKSKILLGRSERFPGKMYSVLAGFADIGESLEECVKREVYEETNIKIKNVKYFGSQAWPFPDSLMIAYTAEYKSGEIKIDNDELSDAKWFDQDNLPEIPGHPSIAGKLINNFLKNF